MVAGLIALCSQSVHHSSLIHGPMRDLCTHKGIYPSNVWRVAIHRHLRYTSADACLPNIHICTISLRHLDGNLNKRNDSWTSSRPASSGCGSLLRAQFIYLFTQVDLAIYSTDRCYRDNKENMNANNWLILHGIACHTDASPQNAK